MKTNSLIIFASCFLFAIANLAACTPSTQNAVKPHTTAATNTIETNSASTIIIPIKATGVIIVDAAALRDGPGSDQALIINLKKGTKVSINGVIGNQSWLLVQIDVTDDTVKVGWIYTEFVAIITEIILLTPEDAFSQSLQLITPSTLQSNINTSNTNNTATLLALAPISTPTLVKTLHPQTSGSLTMIVLTSPTPKMGTINTLIANTPTPKPLIPTLDTNPTLGGVTLQPFNTATPVPPLVPTIKPPLPGATFQPFTATAKPAPLPCSLLLCTPTPKK